MRDDPPAIDAALGRLIAPIGPQRFFSEYWQKKPLIINRGDPAYHDDLLTIGDLDRLISEIALPTAQIDMGQNAVGVDKANFDRGGYIDPQRLLRLHRAGNTIIMRAMELWLPRLRTLCSAASACFLAETQTNLYLTPSNTHSSYPHWDSHDLFIIQIAGSKTWKVHATEMDAPLPSYRFDPDRHPIGPQLSEFTIHAGDLAYLPRGLAHNPMAEQYSVHISLGVLVKTWADILGRTLSTAILAEPALRQALPVRFGEARFDAGPIAERCAEIFALALDAERLKDNLEAMTTDLVAARPVETGGQLALYAAESAISLRSVIEIPAAPTPLRERGDGLISAILNGVELAVDRRYAPALEFIAGARRVRVADIPAGSDAHRIALAQKLAEEGCLSAVYPEAVP